MKQRRQIISIKLAWNGIQPACLHAEHSPGVAGRAAPESHRSFGRLVPGLGAPLTKQQPQNRAGPKCGSRYIGGGKRHSQPASRLKYSRSRWKTKGNTERKERASLLFENNEVPLFSCAETQNCQQHRRLSAPPKEYNTNISTFLSSPSPPLQQWPLHESNLYHHLASIRRYYDNNNRSSIVHQCRPKYQTSKTRRKTFHKTVQTAQTKQAQTATRRRNHRGFRQGQWSGRPKDCMSRLLSCPVSSQYTYTTNSSLKLSKTAQPEYQRQ